MELLPSTTETRVACRNLNGPQRASPSERPISDALESMESSSEKAPFVSPSPATKSVSFSEASLTEPPRSMSDSAAAAGSGQMGCLGTKPKPALNYQTYHRLSPAEQANFCKIAVADNETAAPSRDLQTHEVGQHTHQIAVINCQALRGEVLVHSARGRSVAQQRLQLGPHTRCREHVPTKTLK